jgi:hypothetical protein
MSGRIRNVHHNDYIAGPVVDNRASDCCVNERQSTRAPDVSS